MFFFQLFIFLVSIILLSFSISGNGLIITKNLKRNFFLDFFFGLIVISLIITTVHFFFKINLIISSVIFLLGLILFFKNINLNFLKYIKKKIIIYPIIVLLLLPMLVSQKYHEDFGYYHLPYVLAFLENKIVFGFANIDKPYVFNSIWLNLNSIFFFKNNNFNFLTLPSFLLFIFFIFFSINKLLKKKEFKSSDYYLIITLFYFIIKFTRVSEFGVDLPAIIFSILSIYYFIKFFEVDKISEKKIIFYYNLAFSIFSILIKFSTGPIIFLTIYLFVKNFKELKSYIFGYRFLIIYFFIIIFLIQQFIYTGCLFFPSSLTCLNVSWFNVDYIHLSKQLELINKSYSIAKDIYQPQEYLENFNWFSFWLKRNYVEISEHLITIFLPSLIFIFFLKKKASARFLIKEKKIIYFFLLINLFFWLNFSPVYRFGVHLFVTLSFIVLLNLFNTRSFSRKIFIIFISIFFMFNFSKNLKRIFESPEIFLGIQKMNNKYLLNELSSNEYAKVYIPHIEKNKKNGWQGRLCWDIPFICSYNKIKIDKKYGYLFINKLNN